MFNFQKEVVINSIDQFKVVEPSTTITHPMDSKLRIHGGGEYFAKYLVEAVYKTEAKEPKSACFVLDAAAIKAAAKGSHIQILIELGLDNDYRGDYGSALYYFRKPVLIDLGLDKLDGEELAKAFKKAIPSSYKFLHVYTNTSEDMPEDLKEFNLDKNKVGLFAEDCYIKIRDVKVIDFTCNSRCEGESEEPVIMAHMKKSADGVFTISGDAGDVGSGKMNVVEFGTYNYMIHNLRLPTYANLRFMSPSASEMPVQGNKYTQYSFAYCVPRVGFGGMSVAGQANHSITLHTFYVAEGTVQSEFEKALEIVFGEGCVKDIKVNGDHSEITILPDSHATKSDLETDTE